MFCIEHSVHSSDHSPRYADDNEGVVEHLVVAAQLRPAEYISSLKGLSTIFFMIV